MAYNGSGTFNRLYNWVSDKNNSIPITASRMDDEMNGMATALSNCITRDGQSTPLNNLPMAAFRFTNVGDAVADNEFASLGQVKSQVGSRTGIWGGTSTGTATAYVVNPAVTVTLTAGLSVDFLPHVAGTGGATTLQVGALTATAVKKRQGNGLVDLANTDLPTGCIATAKYNGTVFELVNVKPYTQGASIASAATVDLTTATGDFVTITGVTGITAITMVNGDSKDLYFSSALTITHGASLVCPYSANLAISAGDLIRVRRDGTITRVIPLVQAVKTFGALSINVADLNGGPIAGNRNALINGGLAIWQRGSSFAITATGTPAYTADRWAFLCNAGVLATTISRTTLAGGAGNRFAIRVQRNAANANTNAHQLGQCILSHNVYPLQGKQVTLSFYATAGANYSAASGALVSQVIGGTGTDEGINGAYQGTWAGISTIVSQANNITTTRTRYSVTFTVPTTVNEMVVNFSFVPVGAAGANDWFEIDSAQLEIGPVATAFELLPFENVLNTCLFYYEKSFKYAVTPAVNIGIVGDSWLGIQGVAASTATFFTIPFKARKRVDPAATLYQVNGAGTQVVTGAGVAFTATSIGFSTTRGLVIGATSPAGTVAGGTAYLDWTADAEL